MRTEIINWWKQAEYDLVTAKVLLDGKRLDAASFYCQQCIEKALKAYALLKKRESPGPIHSLIKLAKFVELPKRFYRFLKSLSPEYYISRYPDASEDIPFTIYTKVEVEEYLAGTKEVMGWLSTQMKE